MGNKMGFMEKTKLYLCWILHPRMHVLTVTCELCGSTNIVRIGKGTVADKSTPRYERKIYSADYLCLDCKARCHVTQDWGKLSEKAVQEIMHRIQGVRNG